MFQSEDNHLERIKTPKIFRSFLGDHLPVKDLLMLRFPLKPYVIAYKK